MSEQGQLAAFVSAEQAHGLDALTALLDTAHKVAICAHTSPDGDALGSGLALALVLRARWPELEVCGLLADAASIPRVYRFLPGSDELVFAEKYTDAPDVFICVDLSHPSRLTEAARTVMGRSQAVAVIDHHPTDEMFWDAGIVRPSAAATGVLVAEYAERLGVQLSTDAAQCLLCALMTDTGRLSYQNADAEAFAVGQVLVAAGARPAEVAVRVYQSDTLAYLHLSATVLSRIQTAEAGRVAYSYVTLDDLARHGVATDECDGLVDLVRSVDGSEAALFLKEVANGRVRGNLRSKSDLDVSVVARVLGGGGHKAAAGFTVEGTAEQALDKVLPLLCDCVAKRDIH